MASNLNFKGFGNEPPPEGSGSGRPSGNFPLVSQSSIYSLTFDEFRNSLGREFGSMNMDELLKNIWTAEETQNMAPAAASTVNGGQVGGNQGGFLQRQGSVTLPRTLSQKTVDEVWKDVSKEFRAGKDTGTGASVPQAAKRQPTLGEITLEEFLVRAGVVREDAQFVGKPNPGGFLGDIVQANNGNTGFGIDFQQPNRGVGLMGSHLTDNSARIPLQPPTLPVNVNGMRSSQHQPVAQQAPQRQQQQQQQQQQQPQQPPIYPKQSAVSYAPTMTIPGSTQLGLTNRTANGMQGMGGGGLQDGAMGVAAGSPAAFSADRLGKSKGDTPSVSPHPFMFNGGLRGRKSNHQVEKVIERRQRRMIKNRESAARSRQRKQAYTEELEEEVNKLKKENEELQQKQAQVIEMQKNEMLEMVRKGQLGSRRTRLKRTHTGPW